MSEPASTTPPGRMPPRVRIAPSPTGDPHVGTAYIALFNYVFARKHGGQFILRIEDTDQERSTASSERAILQALRWLGLSWNEGPDVGGPNGPYRQSERLASYREAVDDLLQRRRAYRCFCTTERLDELRKIQMAEKRPPGYDRHCRDLDPAEAERRAAAGEPHVVRMMVPLAGETIVRDELRGNVHFQNSTIDDQVLMKSDGFPTYHLANVVDDHAMGITHVIRGEEWITSTPKHVLLYEAFGWEAPLFYHLGLLRNSDKSKLSKRKNPVSVFYYRDLGIMPETFLNYLGTLGFSISDEVERFTLDEMVEHFDWSRVSTGGPVFDPVKLEAFNANDIRAMTPEVLLDRLQRDVFTRERMLGLVRVAQERITRLDDFVGYVECFFGGTIEYTNTMDKLRKDLKARSIDDVAAVLHDFVEGIERDEAARAVEKGALEAFTRGFCESKAWKPKELFTLLRIASTGRTAAPPLFDTLELLGKDRVRMRLRSFVEQARTHPAWASA
jgi:glutamyl-tRNA synthetase